MRWLPVVCLSTGIPRWPWRFSTFRRRWFAPSAYAPDLPISLEKIILKATMKNPDRRYATIEDLLMDLKKALVSPNEDFVTMIDAD